MGWPLKVPRLTRSESDVYIERGGRIAFKKMERKLENFGISPQGKDKNIRTIWEPKSSLPNFWE